MRTTTKDSNLGFYGARRNHLAMAALSVLALWPMSYTQAATIVGYTVDGTYDGTGTVVGYFDVNTSTDAVTAVDLAVSGTGGITGFTATNPNAFEYFVYASPSFINLDTEDYDGHNLYLGFSQFGGALVSTGFGSSAIQQYFGASYAISGTIAEGPAVTGGVPEPSAWALMLVGFGLLGAMLRTRGRPKVSTIA